MNSRVNDIRSARGLFPHTEGGLIYLNHAAVSPLSTEVVAAMRRHLDRRSAGPVETYFDDMKFVPSLRKKVSDWIGAGDPDRIALFGNTSDALNVVAAGLRWERGDRVLLNDMEFPANVYPYVALRRRGVEIDTIHCPGNIITAEMIEAALTPRTRVVALSAVQFLTGFKADLASIGGLCRSKGVLFFVDGIQAVGATVIDVASLKIDALAAGAQKWLMGPEGTGFLYLTEAVQEQVDQQHIGWLSVKTPWDFRDHDQPLHPSAKRYEGGTWNVAGLRGMDAALAVLSSVGRETVAASVNAGVSHLLDLFDGIDGVRLVSPRAPEQRAGIVTVDVGGPDRAQQVFDRLVKEGISISIREGLLRVSPHFYNTRDELERCVAVVRTALR